MQEQEEEEEEDDNDDQKGPLQGALEVFDADLAALVLVHVRKHLPEVGSM